MTTFLATARDVAPIAAAAIVIAAAAWVACSARFHGVLADGWEQRRRTRALARQVDAQEAALWVLARVEQDRADALILRTAERFALDVSFATTAAQIDALETTEERA